ncbi:MAG: class I SAM-dependent methyltransferase [Acidobacteria bacterium]|nr:class I SAM-dependent methyltransferase [Acidobacteriota bacterium]
MNAWVEIAADRVRAQPSYHPISIKEVYPLVAERLSSFPLSGDSDELVALEANIQRTTAALTRNGGLGLYHNGTTDLGRLVFHLTRALKPGSAIETGVAHGVTSAHILAAMALNGTGGLTSIDLPPLVPSEVESQVGVFIPTELRSRWHLRRGSSRQLLAREAQQSADLRLFVHDSLHTYRTMRFEFETVLPYLSRPAVIVSDDIESNRAFEVLTRRPEVTFSAVFRQAGKTSLAGLAVIEK